MFPSSLISLYSVSIQYLSGKASANVPQRLLKFGYPNDIPQHDPVLFVSQGVGNPILNQHTPTLWIAGPLPSLGPMSVSRCGTQDGRQGC